MVKIKWFGHACIAVIRSDNYTIVFDPHDGYSIGLRKPDVVADLILVSHDHFDHNAVKSVSKKESRVLKEFFGEVTVDNVVVKGFKTYHDKDGGRKRGLNAVYLVETEGFRIAHMGDLGDTPEPKVIDSIRNVDILFIPVGGVYTVEPIEAAEIVDKVKPKNVMPIHYWISGLRLPLREVGDFLNYVKGFDIVKLDTNEFLLEQYSGKLIVAKYV
ncbi:MAG: MBL fold metallo-hydrolase [Desulfurococcaceae archaeon]|uniref:Zn-dependent hydrolase n=1 Tax=Staphylothermus marinus TaxID=2280 RepID=A0A7C4JLK6_STAMA